MKNSVLIIPGLVLTLILAFSATSKAQDSTKVLIGKETSIVYGKASAKVVCNNEDIAKKLLFAFQQVYKGFSCTWKTDRYGRYKHYVINVSKPDAELIVNWAKTNL